MKVKVLKSTDGQHVGQEYTVPDVTKEVMLNFGMPAVTISWEGNFCTVQNSHYTIYLEKIEA